MKRFNIYSLVLLCALNLVSLTVKAQKKQKNTLFTAGHASAFIGGLYDAYFPYSQLKLHGNFGLGAPDKVDGELLVLDGKLYQTKSSGKTVEIPDTGRTPFAMINFFKADESLKTTVKMSKDKLYAFLDSVMPNQNLIYAIRIKGEFKTIKTRAFPPAIQKPYKPLAQMLPLQKFFKFEKIKGVLVGYRIPSHMEGPNISGYHFHFLSEDKQAGGHIIDLLTNNVTIEIDHLNSFTVDLPQTLDFQKFDLKKDRREDVKNVENGSI